IINIVFFSFVLSACQPGWQIEITSNDQTKGLITAQDVKFYLDISEEEIETVPLGQLLYVNGFSLIDEITLISAELETKSFIWDKVASSATISDSGKVAVNRVTYRPEKIIINESGLASEIDLTILDIAPTIAHVLGLPDLPDAIGKVRHEAEAERCVMILLDGLQYKKLITLIDTEQLPFLEQTIEVQQGLTVYPSVTTSATAAVLTGTTPQNNGVYGHGFRSTELTTLFDLAIENGKSVIAVEGASLPFNLRNAETMLSGDRDGNGYSDDNVFMNSLEVINSNMPDLMYIHFHEIDDMGHTFGPESSEYETALIRVDGYLEKIYSALPENSFITIFADHGMHTTENGGNHGTLTAADLIIPIIYIEK
ncbi:MAG: alkaline phosphatase family protein, partial [Chloroflexota bacterium]|nr:alkaline phosphatase family protein [Chloroflexota bacterium]